MNFFIPLIVNGSLNGKNLSVESNCVYCPWSMTAMYASMYALLYFSLVMMSFIFMVCARKLVLIVLHRHKQRAQQIHSYSPSDCVQSGRDTCIILNLAYWFAVFYSVNINLTLCMILANKCGQCALYSSVLLASCVSALSPICLIISDTCVFQVCFSFSPGKKAFS